MLLIFDLFSKDLEGLVGPKTKDTNYKKIQLILISINKETLK